MGSGKGEVSQYRVRVKPGKILFEINGVSDQEAKDVFQLAGHKLPVLVKTI